MRNQRSARRNSAPCKGKKGSPLGRAMTRVPNFASIDFAAVTPTLAPAGAAWLTPEGIAVKPVYRQDDVRALDFLDPSPATPPYLRGPYPTMYAPQPGTTRQ